MRDISDINAEYSVLRGLIEDPTLIHVTTLTADHFSDTSRSTVFTAILDLANNGLKIDPITIVDRCPTEIRQEVVNVVSDALSGIGDPKNFVAYEAIVLKAHRKDFIESQGRYLADNPDQLDAVLAKLTTSGTTSRWEYDQVEAVNKAHRLLERMQDGVAGITTGFPDWDRITQGLMPGRLTVLGGRPGMGKTALAMQLALNSGVPVGFISSEMSVDQITLRALSSVSGVPLSIAQSGMNPQEWDKWNAGAAAFKELPIYINDRPGITISEIHRQARKWVYSNGVRLVLIDYAQNLGEDPREDRVENIRAVVKGAKSIARHLDIHVVLLSQVKREVEARADKRPGMRDFDGASTLEAEADHGVTLYRDWVYNDTSPKTEVEIIHVKNRHGTCPFRVHADFHSETTSFVPSRNARRLAF